MQIKLIAVSHPELGNIAIQDSVFAIGRNEAPFSTYDKSITANLSRRHARLFQEAGSVFIADLESRNGTKVNHKSVGQKATRVLDGDIISLGGRLDFRLEIDEPNKAAVDDQAQLPQLLLAPLQASTQRHSITITAFPFLVGKASEPFRNALEDMPAYNEYLSRRHAHFFYSENTIFIEDLGSTNGTFVNGERLDEQARQLNADDEIAFGSKELSYRVQFKPLIEQPADTVSQDPIEAGSENTVFVSSATSFLDIFCSDEVEPKQEESKPASPPSTEAKPKHHRQNPLSRFFSFIGEIREALQEPGTKRRRGGLVLVALLLVGGVSATYYLTGAPKRSISQALAQQDYQLGIKLAQEYLVENPNDADVLQWAHEAALNIMLPRWIGHIERNDFEQANRVIQLSEPLVPKGDGDGEWHSWLALLSWITKLNAYVFDRGGMDAPLRMYQDEATTNQLLAWWNSDKRKHRHNMGKLLNLVAAFDQINTRTFSYVRLLRDDTSVNLVAIDKLQRSIDDKLAQQRHGELAALLQEFGQKYPRIVGADALQQDLDKYLALNELAADPVSNVSQLAQFERQLGSDYFATPPFQAQAKHLLAQVDQLQPWSETWQQARHDWRQGELEAALITLEQLGKQTGNEQIIRDWQTKRSLYDEFAQLNSLEGSEEHGKLLISLYSKLDSNNDAYLLALLEQDYRRLGELASKSADSQWQLAREQWRDYLDNGGIRGGLRLENEVSSLFAKKAGQLSEAKRHVEQGYQLYQDLNLPMSSEQKALYDQIQAETALQKRSIEQLSMVLSPDMLRAKLELLGSVNQ